MVVRKRDGARANRDGCVCLCFLCALSCLTCLSDLPDLSCLPAVPCCTTTYGGWQAEQHGAPALGWKRSLVCPPPARPHVDWLVQPLRGSSSFVLLPALDPSPNHLPCNALAPMAIQTALPFDLNLQPSLLEASRNYSTWPPPALAPAFRSSSRRRKDVSASSRVAPLSVPRAALRPTSPWAHHGKGANEERGDGLKVQLTVPSHGFGAGRGGLLLFPLWGRVFDVTISDEIAQHNSLEASLLAPSRWPAVVASSFAVLSVQPAQGSRAGGPGRSARLFRRQACNLILDRYAQPQAQAAPSAQLAPTYVHTSMHASSFLQPPA
ncbi:uncharacterized protein PSFLO_00712 [Pseudozyma flocculosa]|uniref:Uncharacterized protein n=1 Tax=Pseudozyma flocculosa TaxID=84751 RepID=A0A5C3EVW9_9BASI|nr:uncharacterized protein PSFLO_00712 [Pseudozyma flocculosa]